MRVDLNVQMAKAKAQSAAAWSGSELVCACCSAARKNTELCGDDHAPVTRGRMRAQYPLPHGRVQSPIRTCRQIASPNSRRRQAPLCAEVKGHKVGPGSTGAAHGSAANAARVARPRPYASQQTTELHAPA